MESLRILVADDDRVTRRIVSVKLSGLGHEVTEASDGLEAWERLQQGSLPDLAIVDHNMPRMNGLELLRAIRDSEDAGRALLPVIMLTSRQGEEDIVESIEAGLDDYIPKPFSPDELAARVQMVMWRLRRSIQDQ